MLVAFIFLIEKASPTTDFVSSKWTPELQKVASARRCSLVDGVVIVSRRLRYTMALPSMSLFATIETKYARAPTGSCGAVSNLFLVFPSSRTAIECIEASTIAGCTAKSSIVDDTRFSSPRDAAATVETATTSSNCLSIGTNTKSRAES